MWRALGHGGDLLIREGAIVDAQIVDQAIELVTGGPAVGSKANIAAAIYRVQIGIDGTGVGEVAVEVEACLISVPDHRNKVPLVGYDWNPDIFLTDRQTDHRVAIVKQDVCLSLAILDPIVIRVKKYPGGIANGPGQEPELPGPVGKIIVADQLYISIARAEIKGGIGITITVSTEAPSGSPDGSVLTESPGIVGIVIKLEV